MFFSFTFILFSLSANVYSARILGVFPTPSISHQVFFQGIWKELSLRGHEVTVISPNIINDKSLTNLTEIDTGFMYDLLKQEKFNFAQIMRSNRGPKTAVKNVLESPLVQIELESEKVQELIHDKDKKFDLVLAELIDPVLLAFSVKYQAPVVAMYSFMGMLSAHDALGNPVHPIALPDIFLPYGVKKTLYERLYAVYFRLWMRYYNNYVVYPKSTALARKLFGDHIPDLREVEKNISLMIINSNIINNYPRPLVPGVIEVGQIHIKKPKPLPKDLKDYLDKSERGVIYFSLGSNVKSANESQDFIDKIKGALGEVPYDVMWKWESDDMPNKPDNILLKKWFPQQDVLAHPNIKVFVTQGGLQSMEESIMNTVPLVVLPFIADQPYNAQRMVELGIAIKLNPFDISKKDLKAAIIEVAQNPSYKENVINCKNIMLDQPMNGLDKAIWWIEYVIRHKGAYHLRYPGKDLPFYQYYFLDIIAIVLLVPSLSIITLVLLSNWVLNIMKSKHDVKRKLQ